MQARVDSAEDPGPSPDLVGFCGPVMLSRGAGSSTDPVIFHGDDSSRCVRELRNSCRRRDLGRTSARNRKFRVSLPRGFTTTLKCLRVPEVCLFLAYSAHQQPATSDKQKQVRETRKLLVERRIGSNQQLKARRGKTRQMTSVSAVNRRVIGSSPIWGGITSSSAC